jgi:hypothetical protein
VVVPEGRAEAKGIIRRMSPVIAIFKKNPVVFISEIPNGL